MLRSTTDIKRQAPSALLSGLRSESEGQSKEAGLKLIASARDYGLDLRSYLRLAVDPRLSEGDERKQYVDGEGKFINGYEAALSYLHLPVRDDLDGGIMLQAAADTFQTFPGTRAMFPEVIDDMVQWKYRQTNFETTAGMVAQTRTVNGVELLTTVVEDAQADYEETTRAIAEGSRVPIHSIRTSEHSVKFWKYGNGYKVTYEFARRAGLDLLTPYAQRTQAQIERSKVAAATSMLINGDGLSAHPAATVVDQSDFDTDAGVASTPGKIAYRNLTAWLISRAKNGTPVDTIVGNWDAYLQWLWLFAVPSSDKLHTDVELMARSGYQLRGIPILQGSVDFVLSSTAPANQLIGFSKADTLEELVEAGSLINESERSIETQEVKYVKTINAGYRLVFGDTRSIFDYSA
jgi:hypothetical protein